MQVTIERERLRGSHSTTTSARRHRRQIGFFPFFSLLLQLPTFKAPRCLVELRHYSQGCFNCACAKPIREPLCNFRTAILSSAANQRVAVSWHTKRSLFEHRLNINRRQPQSRAVEFVQPRLGIANHAAG